MWNKEINNPIEDNDAETNTKSYEIYFKYFIDNQSVLEIKYFLYQIQVFLKPATKLL